METTQTDEMEQALMSTHGLVQDQVQFRVKRIAEILQISQGDALRLWYNGIPHPQPDQVPFEGEYRVSNGFLCNGSVRLMRADFDTNPSDEFKREFYDYLLRCLNGRPGQTHDGAGFDVEGRLKEYYVWLCAKLPSTEIPDFFTICKQWVEQQSETATLKARLDEADILAKAVLNSSFTENEKRRLAQEYLKEAK